MLVLLLCFLGGEKFPPFFICVKTNLSWQVVTKKYLICYKTNLSWQGVKWGCQPKFKAPSGSTK
jgi:hypothetical protein